MDSLFLTRVLTMAINQIVAIRTPILDRVFARKVGQLSDRFAWDIRTSDERLLSNISVFAPASVEDKTDRKTVTCQAPRFAPKRLISAAELNAVRGFGEQWAPELLANRIRDEQFDMRLEIDRTREYMALTALKGVVVDADGTELVDYGFVSAQKPDLSGADLWTADTGDPIANIRAWKKWIADRVPNVTSFVAFSGSDVMDALINNANARELLQYTAGQQIAQEGRIALLAGVEIEEYFGTYKTSGGTRTDLIPANAFMLVGLSPDAFAEYYAPVVDLEAPTGVGKGVAGQMFFSKSWESPDPSGRWIKAEARPLPVVLRPEAVVYALPTDL